MFFYDVIGICKSDGKEIVRYFYDSFGRILCQYLSNVGTYVDIEDEMEYINNNETNSFIATLNPYRYRSYIYDKETKLYYLNSRYYDPEVCRFINTDKIKLIAPNYFNGLNLYIYCNNNPIKFLDKNGQYPIANVFNNWIENVKNIPISNFVNRVYLKKEIEIFSDRYLQNIFGNVTFSAKKYILNPKTGFFYQASEMGNEGFSHSVGINALDILGVEVGYDDNYNLFYNVNITPYLHFGTSIGAQGFGFNGGIIINNTSYDFDIHVGWGTAAVIVTAIVAPVVSPFVAFFNWLFSL